MTDDVKALVEKARLWKFDEVAFDPGAAANLIVKLADALEAATVAPAVDRVKASMVLWEVLWPGTVDVMDHPELGAERFKVRQILDALTSSNVLRDVRDVQAEGADLAADWLAQQLWPDAADYAGHVRQFAQAIREARNER